MSSDTILIDRIQTGELEAWEELIARFEGRLLAFVESRLGRRSAGEDVVQETFIGFLTSLPNYERSRPLESYLFSIAAHKLTDHLRREGRRPRCRWQPASRASSRSTYRAKTARPAAFSAAVSAGRSKRPL